MGIVPDYVADSYRQPSITDMLGGMWGSAKSVGQTVASAAQSMFGGGGFGGGGYPCLTDMGGGHGGGGLGGGGYPCLTDMGGGGMSPGGYPWLTDMGGGMGGGMGGATGTIPYVPPMTGGVAGAAGSAAAGAAGSLLQSLPFLDMYGDDHKPGELRPMNAGDYYEKTGEVIYT